MVLGCRICRNSRIRLVSIPVIGILPFGEISGREVDSVKTAIQRLYGFEVKVLDPVQLPKMAYTEIRYPRYRADSILLWLGGHIPDSLDMMVGLTNKDISVTKYLDARRLKIKEPEWQYRDFGVFGLGSVGGSTCVVSSNRLWHKTNDDKVFYDRLKRISCHEVGHVLGLHHCPVPDCLMNDANESIGTVDKSTGKLCDKCRQQIY